MKVAFITPYDVPCGIATYSKKLIKTLSTYGVKVEVISNIKDHLSIKKELDKSDAETVHIQHEFELYPNTDELIRLLGFIRYQNKKLVITMHTEKCDEIDVIKKYCDFVILHNDVYNISAFDKKIVRIPHPIPNISLPHPKSFYKEKFGILKDSFVIGATGFLITLRRFDNIIDNLSNFLKENKNIYLHLVTSSKNDIKSQETALMIKNTILDIARKKNFVKRIYIGDAFFPFEEYYQRIYTLDLGFSYCPNCWVSSSGSVTEMLGCRVPLVVNDVDHFRSINECSWTVNTIEEIAPQIINIYENHQWNEKIDLIEIELKNKAYSKILLRYIDEIYK